MMRKLIHPASLALAVFVSSSVAWSATQITAMDFSAATGELILKGNGPLMVSKDENVQDKQVILEIKDAEFANKNLERKLDTSSFNVPVMLISPYKSPDGKSVRIVLQMREMSQSDLLSEGETIRLKLAGGGDASAPADATAATDAVPAAPSDGPPGADEPAAGESVASSETPAAAPVEAKEEPGSKDIDDFLARKESRRYVGKPITLQLRDADVVDIFRLISDASGFNIILSPNVKGKLTLSLTDVPWDLALDTVFQTLRLGGRRSGNVLRVALLNELAAEANDELVAKRASEASAPRVTKIFAISYADASQLSSMVSAFGAANNVSGGQPTFVQVDSRTNSLVIQDTEEKVKKIQKLVEILDTQTPQVLIESKIVEVSETARNGINGAIGLGNNNDGTQFFGSFMGANPVDPLFGSPSIYTDGNGAAKAQANGGAFGLSPKISFLPGVNRLNALLSLSEAESQAKIVASPRVVVLNKESATIVNGVPVPVQQVVNGSGGSSGGTGVSTQSADMNLTVKPTVTNDGSVHMVLSVARNTPDAGGFGMVTRTLSTTVLVESGNTLVIGGIYTMNTLHSAAGFPMLRKLPIIGALFGNEADSNNRSELLIFITPRILNSKESGRSG